jgi:hypothetical protein
MKKITDSTAFKWATFAGALLVVGGSAYAIYKKGMTKDSVFPALMLLAGVSALTMAGGQVFTKPMVAQAPPKKEVKTEEGEG